ncbi:MAG: hypothetical protein DRP18_03130 [Candidatus Aenigmatarchaeota archaeon]|nr:MAG: hypothetical protein DRP18_03130 [Candidatus Aenigmarchaeota archaeon]
MDGNPWYWISLIGAPETWVAMSIALVVVYFVLRFGLKGGSAWERKKHVFGRFVLLLVVALTISWVFTLALKAVTNIERPCVSCSAQTQNCNPFCPEDGSFPSGHAVTIFAVFTLLYKFIKRYRFLVFFSIPVLVSYSRIALGVHRMPDVFIGGIIGIIVVHGVWSFDKRLVKKEEKVCRIG